jgi:hypothetical protein
MRELPLMAVTNKCLAQSNKSRHVSRATKDTNGHRPSEQPRPGAVRPASGRFGLLPLMWTNATQSEGRLVGMLLAAKAAAHATRGTTNEEAIDDSRDAARVGQRSGPRWIDSAKRHAWFLLRHSERGHWRRKFLLLDDRKEEVKSCGDGILVIRADRYDGWEHTCRFTAIRPVFDRDLIATTKTMGVTRMQIDAICKGKGCTWKEQFSLYKEQGSPKFRKERHYQERCGKESAR